MIAHELRLGNYINALDDYDQPIASQVIALSDGAVDIDEYGSSILFYALNGEYTPEQCSIEGINITEEWIKRLDFKEDNIFWFNKFEDNWDNELIGMGISYNIKNNVLEVNESKTRRIKYVHQLQNLYFALTGDELTLNQ